MTASQLLDLGINEDVPDFVSWAFGDIGIPEDTLERLRAALAAKFADNKPTTMMNIDDSTLVVTGKGNKFFFKKSDKSFANVKGTMNPRYDGGAVPISGSAKTPNGAINYSDASRQNQSIDKSANRGEVKYDDPRPKAVDPFAR